MNSYQVSKNHLSIAVLRQIIKAGTRISLSADCKRSIEHCRDYLDNHLNKEGDPIYGINTGFGALYNHIISSEDLEKLQINLVISHSCGMGEEVPSEIVKLMLFLKIQALSYGHSGVQLETVERLIWFFNEDVLPVIYTQGSLGASGDLAPLAHLSLPLIGKGEVYHNGKKRLSADVLKEHNLSPIHLKSKEGLALLNGTQFMSAYGVWSIMHTEDLVIAADLAGALSLEAFDGRIDPFNELLHKIRPHKGQIEVARNFTSILEGSLLIISPKKHVQDPYSFRCIPQVHGATRDTLSHVRQVIETEINSVTDNPTVFPDENLVLSGGNFHGQPLALALDYLALAVAELGNISERRTYQLISGQRDLPMFLVANPGLNSGFMIPQYTAASIVSQNKQYCYPASADSIVSSNGQEDHVSMGANAAVKARLVIDNVYSILGIEIFTAAQAMEFRRPLTSSPVIELLIKNIRKEIPYLDQDDLMYPLMRRSTHFIKSGLMIF